MQAELAFGQEESRVADLPSVDAFLCFRNVRGLVRRRWRGARSSRSRITADFEIFRPCDSASMSATCGSGSRTVRLFL